MTVCFVSVGTGDASAAGEARRTASRLTGELGWDEANCGRAAIVASELSVNLAKHSTGGEIVLQTVQCNGHKWIEILSIDRGPGMVDPERCLVDGYSTHGTPGNGLGAVRRLSTEFDLYSSQPAGTVIFSRLTEAGDHKNSSPSFRWGAISRPAPYEQVCGDCWSVAERPNEFAMMVSDGLGHGPEAANAAAKASEVFEEDPFASLTLMIETANRRMHGTRGAAFAAARIDARTRTLKYLGVGNIAGHLRTYAERSGRGLCSHNGTVGVQLRKVQEFEYECPEQGVMIMHSDGLQSRWSLDSYPGLIHRHPGVAAGVLYRDFTRGRDDVTVAVAKMSFT